MRRKVIDLIKARFGKRAFWENTKNLEYCVRAIFLENFNERRREEVEQWLDKHNFKTGYHKGKKFWFVDAEDLYKIETREIRTRLIKYYKRRTKHGHGAIISGGYVAFRLGKRCVKEHYNLAKEIGFRITGYGDVVVDAKLLSDYLKKQGKTSVVGRPRKKLDYEEIEELYNELGSLRKVASAVGVSKGTVSNILRSVKEKRKS